MTIPVPSMSTRGFITEITERVDQMMVHYVYTDALQSTHFGGRLFSLPATLEKHVGSTLSAANAVQVELTEYFRKYFVQADVIVQTEEADPDNSSSRAVLRITARVTENGQEYEVSKLLSIVDGRFKEFINLNNNEASS